MPNNHFHFKQFTIQQDKCAMKVCTDACILGAWTAMKVEGTGIRSVLDIGTGTGLLSLMLAQKIDAAIDAIEINADTALQASENISVSTWASRISIHNISLQDFIPGKKYDLVISNPPFYEDDLRSGNEDKNAAKHDTGLTLAQLIVFIKNCIADEGRCSLLIPFHRTAYLEKITSENGLFVQEKLLLKQTPRHDPFRTILLISKKQSTPSEPQQLIIHDEYRNYTPDFQELMKEYYLKL